MTIDRDPLHPIIDKLWTWKLQDFAYHRHATDWRESYIDMVLQRGGLIRKLRSWT